MSEFGFQSVPSLKTCESFTLPEDRNIFSYVMEKHQRNVSANSKIMNYMQQTYLYPSDLDDALLYEDYVSYACLKGEQVISSGTVLFCAPKYFRYADPKLQVWAEGDEVVVTARAYAKSVEIINEADDLLLEDNYFDMNAGRRRGRILKGKPEGLKVRSIFDIR